MRTYFKSFLRRRVKAAFGGPPEFSHSQSKDKPIKDLRPPLTDLEANNWIKDRIREKKPFMVARFGSTELTSLLKIEACKEFGLIDRLKAWAGNENIGFRKKVFWPSVFFGLQKNSGFFPCTKKELSRFFVLMEDAIPYVDLLGSWVKGEDRFAKDLIYAEICALGALSQFGSEESWTKALAGKKVLIVHPYSQSIRYQYQHHREQIWPKSQSLPQFDLLTVKAVQTLGGYSCGFDCWFSALDWMTEQCLKKDFEIAILGCGAYGFPLAARLKNEGHQVIHLGGNTQLLFGIKGARWDRLGYDETVYNSFWKRPDPEEIPEGAKDYQFFSYA